VTPWKPRASPLTDVLSLDLTVREGHVLSQIDGATGVEHLAQLTGLKPAELSAVLERLVSVGAIEPPPDPPPAATPPPVRPAGAEEPASEAPASTHRQLFETQFHPLSQDERAQLASVAEDPALSALCFDPLPTVIHHVLENPRTGLVHARLIAANHRNPVGLEALAARAAFLQDREVQRLLLRNSQSPETVVRRILAPRRLADIYLTCRSRELPERQHRAALSLLRNRFATAAPEERVDLILTTEGRALGMLSGLSLDGRSVSLLCSRGISSTLLIENLGYWPATPPPLILHLLKQPQVRQTPALKLLLRRHANCPRSAR
jgi:hypothetical protein